MFELHGYDLFGEPVKLIESTPLKDKFLFPPFSVIDTKQGEWQERKRAWVGIGLKSEEGRKDELTFTGAAKSLDFYRVKEGTRDNSKEQATSIFDPVLCELAYRWFCPTKGMILDPFAGGSVRGVIAALMGFEYTGIELRPEQVTANREQGETLCPDHRPCWIEGDSNNVQELTRHMEADMVFSCPPYGYLEKYSDDPRDLSNMSYADFLASYENVIKETCGLLKNNSFACFVVGNFRDKDGHYHDFVGDTVKAFRKAGLHFYNDAILLNCVASASMRASKQFDAGRKLVKIHQNVLVFVKGEGKKAAAKILNQFGPEAR